MVWPNTATVPPDASELVARSGLARWLAYLFAGECDPGEPFATDRLSPALREPIGRLRAVDPTLAESERVRLFVNAPGGIAAPPFASWWLDGEIAGPSATEVGALYLQEGLRGTEGSGPPDGLSAELEFLHFLLQHQIAARLTGSVALERDSRRRERRFLDEHLRRWLPSFCGAVRTATDDAFWTEAVGLLETFIEDEVRRARTP